MTFVVTKPGLLTLIQDQGRFGFQHQGLTTGGMLDEYAGNWANRLLGNSLSAPLIEIALGNVSMTATADTIIAVTGAAAPIWVNEHPISMWRIQVIRAGDAIRIGWARSGQRLYVAVRGGFQVTPAFGSTATVVREKVGGLSGTAILANDQLPFTPVTLDQGLDFAAPQAAIPNYDQSVQMRVVLGNQIMAFSEQAKTVFFQSTYHLTADSDRMGFRLSGPAVHYGGDTILSEGIAFGAIQVPPDGQPIIMLKDRQTIGGYPKIGGLLPIDAFRLSQMKAGASVSFAPIALEQAQALMQDFYRFFDSPNDSPLS
jgi:biotin-dependent carboxylase-like uncharacterized protein